MISLFRPQPTGKEIESLKEVIDSGWWGMGPKVEEFEKAWAEKCGAKYAVAVNSCTAALDIACRIVPLPNPVRVSAFTFISSALAPLNAGYKVEFVDINPETFSSEDDDIHVCYGGLVTETRAKIYDMAHCGGEKHRGEVSCWSFHAVKNLPTGDGGMLTMNDEALYRRAKALSWCGIDKSTWERSGKKYNWDYDIEEPGLKCHMNDLTAAIGLAQLEELDKGNAHRRYLAGLYDIYLPKWIKRPVQREIWHIYNILVPNRNGLIDYLAEKGISTGCHYKPLYNYRFFHQKPLPNTEKAFNETISLPLHPGLTKEDIETVCQEIAAFYSKKS